VGHTTRRAALPNDCPEGPWPILERLRGPNADPETRANPGLKVCDPAMVRGISSRSLPPARRCAGRSLARS